MRGAFAAAGQTTSGSGTGLPDIVWPEAVAPRALRAAAKLPPRNVRQALAVATSFDQCQCLSRLIYTLYGQRQMTKMKESESWKSADWKLDNRPRPARSASISNNPANIHLTMCLRTLRAKGSG